MAKHRWPVHIARLSDNRWTITTTEWTPRDWTRKQGRPKTRWRDDLTKQLGPAWSRLAKDRYCGINPGRGSSARGEFSPDDDGEKNKVFVNRCNDTSV